MDDCPRLVHSSPVTMIFTESRWSTVTPWALSGVAAVAPSITHTPTLNFPAHLLEGLKQKHHRCNPPVGAFPPLAHAHAHFACPVHSTTRLGRGCPQTFRWSEKKIKRFPFPRPRPRLRLTFFCRTGACSSPSSTNFSTPPCCATAVSLLPSSPPSPPPPPLLNHTYTNSQGPLERHPKVATHPAAHSSTAAPVLTVRLLTTSSPLHPARSHSASAPSWAARPARANRLALTGSLCDSELLACPRPRAASRAIISPCLALLPPLAKPPPDTTSEAGLVAGCLSCCSTTRRCCSSRAHRLTTLGLGRESPTSAVGNKVHSQLPRCLTRQSVVTAPAPLLPLQPPSPPPRTR